MWLPIILPVFVLCAVMAMGLAESKGRNKYGWFCVGVLSGPLAFIVAFLPSIKPVEEAQMEMPFALTESGEISLENETRPCPLCGEEIKIEAEKCDSCGAVFDPAEVEREAAHCRAELRENWEQGLKRCPICRTWDVHEAFLEDGSWGDWCPKCAKSLKLMKSERKIS